MSRYEEIETFVQVVNAGSITAAAQQLRIAKSAVSRRLKDLEQRLKVQLLIRSTRKLTLTDTGEALYNRSVNLLSDWAEIEAAASHASVELQGNLRICVPLSFGLTVLSPAILAFQQQHPGVKMDVVFSDRTLDLVADGFDLAIRIGQLQDSSLIARKLTSINTVIVASPAYQKQLGSPKHPEQLQGAMECAYGNRKGNSWHYTAPDGKKGEIELPASLIADNGEFLINAALAGLGLVNIPQFIAQQHLDNGQLVQLFPDYRWQTLGAYAIYPYTRHLSPKVRSLVEYLQEVLV